MESVSKKGNNMASFWKTKMTKDWTEEASIIFEHDITIGDCSYLVIFGRHINGGFICIPNWNIGCEAAGDGDILYNTDKLIQCGLDIEVAGAVAEYIHNFLQEHPELQLHRSEKAE